MSSSHDGRQFYPILKTCIGIDWADPAAQPVAGPITTTDERLTVTVPARKFRLVNSGNPFCGSCLSPPRR
jgi:hypothetical protein